MRIKLGSASCNVYHLNWGPESGRAGWVFFPDFLYAQDFANIRLTMLPSAQCIVRWSEKNPHFATFLKLYSLIELKDRSYHSLLNPYSLASWKDLIRRDNDDRWDCIASQCWSAIHLETLEMKLSKGVRRQWSIPHLILLQSSPLRRGPPLLSVILRLKLGRLLVDSFIACHEMVIMRSLQQYSGSDGPHRLSLCRLASLSTLYYLHALSKGDYFMCGKFEPSTLCRFRAGG